MAKDAALRTSRRPVTRLSTDELVSLELPLRRYVMSRTGDPHQADDIVQETLTRTLSAADRLDVQTLTGYAIAVARNEITSRARADSTGRRHLPRLVDLREPASPEDVVTANESRVALGAALAALPEDARRLLVAHDVHERPLGEIAREENVRPGTLAAQLNRTRARMRVDYVVALRRATLPTARCRPVLLAISASDLRRQDALHAGEHLAGCTVCDELAVPLLNRDRTVAGLLPWVALGTPHGWVGGWLRAHPRAGVTGGASAVVVGLAAATLLVVSHLSPPPDPSPAGVAHPRPAVTSVGSAGPPPPAPAAVPHLTSGGGRVVPATSQLGTAASAPVVATGVVVLAVPGDEGFWVGDDRARIWVQMSGRAESPLQVVAGMRLAFEGTLVRTTPAFVRSLGLARPQDRAAVTAEGVHVEVGEAEVEVVR